SGSCKAECREGHFSMVILSAVPVGSIRFAVPVGSLGACFAVPVPVGSIRFAVPVGSVSIGSVGALFFGLERLHVVPGIFTQLARGAAEFVNQRRIEQNQRGQQEAQDRREQHPETGAVGVLLGPLAQRLTEAR